MKNSYANAFKIDSGFPINHLSFSQRRYQGFRNRTEFDKKRIVLSSKQAYAVHAYDNYMSDTTTILLEEEFPTGHEIMFIDFLEDTVPKYLFLIVNNTMTKTSNLFIK